MDSNEIKKTSIEDLLNRLSTTKNGLSSSEAQKRIAQYGYNEIQEKKVHPLVKILVCEEFYHIVCFSDNEFFSLNGFRKRYN